MPPTNAFEFDRGTYFKGEQHYWRVQERLWNVDADPDPVEQRQYILGRPLYEALDIETKRLSEIDILSHYEEVPQEEAEAAFDEQSVQGPGEESAG